MSAAVMKRGKSSIVKRNDFKNSMDKEQGLD